MLSDNLKCELMNKNGKVCAVTKKHGKLYKMIFNVSYGNWCKSKRGCENNAVCQIAMETITDWHQKLAHQNRDHIRKMLARNNIKFKEDEI
jgi:hypothetical protein